MVAKPTHEQLELDREIDQVAHRFDQALRRGDDVQIDEYLVAHAVLGPGLVTELVWTEIEFRQERGERIDWEHLIDRYPLERARLRDAQARAQSAALGDTSQNSVAESVVKTPSEKPPDATVQQPLAPLDLSDYSLEERIGKGGQGEVHRAMQLSLGRRVAIKLLKDNAADPQSVQRFLREAKSLAQTQHPHIVTIHGIGRTNSGQLFLVMEYVEGLDLAQQLDGVPFSINKSVEIIIKIASAIEHAHRRGVIHRDLKPSNVLWDATRGPVVTDFGLAKDLRAENALSVSDQLLGTPAYMAPEQAHHQFGEISERTDVYGLAATLYALLTGRAPYGPGPISEVLSALISPMPVPEPRTPFHQIPAELSQICCKGLAKQPADRFASPRALAAALERWQSQDATPLDVEAPTVTYDKVTPLHERLEPGGQLGPYQLKAALSRDHSRKVFQAVDEKGQSVLLKVLPAEWLSDRMRRSQFRQEVLLSSGLNHPCLAKVLQAGVIGKTEFLALEYFAGESVAQRLTRDGRFTEAQSISILQPIAEALHLIHGAGVIYRDLRPQNILLVDDQRPMLAEVRFSNELPQHDNATMSGHGEITSKYIAPELLLGRPSDVASDVYTLGATLYSLLTGREPFCEATDTINLMLNKNAQRLTPANQHAPELSSQVLALLDQSLRADRSERPATAAEFAKRLAACGRHPQQPPSESVVADASDNLLHTVWDQLDPELQDAFSLAYNKKRRTGSHRISTRDLFEALSRLGSGPMRQVLTELPAGAIPDPMDVSIPIPGPVLEERPLLSDCVLDSLTQFQQMGPGPQKIAPVDLFVDVAKHGHGRSVVQLREHGVDPDWIERTVKKLGVQVIRRKPQEDSSTGRSLVSDENVQFSVYRPKVIPPGQWRPLLAFAHLSERPVDAPADALDPLAEVERQAAQVLGVNRAAFQSLVADSSQSIPRSSELTFVPTGDGLEFNPPQRSFQWQEPVHREEFRVQADGRINQQVARGRLSVYLGRLLIAEVHFSIRVDRACADLPEQPLSSELGARRFRRIYACVARADVAMVAEFRHYAALLHDEFLTSQLQADPARSTTEINRHIASADVFQLYWSRQAMSSAAIEAEWQFALSLHRPDFIRPLYWEEPFPTSPERSLPPPDLLRLGFQKIPQRQLSAEEDERQLSPIYEPNRAVLQMKAPPGSAPPRNRPEANLPEYESARWKLDRVRPPRVTIDDNLTDDDLSIGQFESMPAAASSPARPRPTPASSPSDAPRQQRSTRPWLTLLIVIVVLITSLCGWWLMTQ